MKTLICTFAILIFLSFSNQNTHSSVSVLSDSAKVCIVSGETIEGDGVSYKYLNQQVILCCKGCESSFKKNPEKFIGAAALWCPVCDEGDAKKDLTFINDSVKYYFCGKGCKEKFSNDPDKYLSNYKK